MYNWDPSGRIATPKAPDKAPAGAIGEHPPRDPLQFTKVGAPVALRFKWLAALLFWLAAYN